MTDTAEAPDRVSPPRTINLAFTALIAHVVLSIGNAALLWGFQDYLREQLIKSNAKAKKPKNPYTLTQVNHDLHSGLTVGLVQTAIFGFLLVLLAVNFRKGKGWARWATILVLVIIVQAPFRLLGLGGHGPLLMRTSSALVGLTGIAVIVLLFMPESSRFYAAVRGVTAGDRTSGAAAMGFRNLFAPRPRPDAGTPAKPSARTSSRTPARAPVKPDAVSRSKQGTSPPPAAERRAKAKARASVDSVVADDSAPTATAKPGTAAKNRGKSRKGT